MKKTRFLILLAVIVLSSMFFSACDLLKANEVTEEDLAMAVTMTLAAIEAQATEVVPTAILEPTPEPTAEPTNTPEPTAIPHALIPGEPPEEVDSEIVDPDSSGSASDGTVSIGEDFEASLFERPFTSEAMQYRPDLDILSANLRISDDFIYVELVLKGQHLDGGLQGTYGFELDLDKNGRGDVLVLANNLQSEWSTEGVLAWADTNTDVGGETPVSADAMPGSGYDTLIFEEGMAAGPVLVWARLSPTNANAVQLAYKLPLIYDSTEYLWWAVADDMVKNPAWYDYNDHFTLEQAGSPIAELEQYPLKELAEIDNTCSGGVGFIPAGPEPRACGDGVMWIDTDGNGIYTDPPDELGEDIEIHVYPESCTGPYVVFNTGISGDLSLLGLAAGVYCVRIANMECGAGTATQIVTVPLDGSINFDLSCDPVE